MNNFQRYPYADYLVNQWLNNYTLSPIEKKYILLRVKDYQNNHQKRRKDLSVAYVFTVDHFPLTLNNQDIPVFAHIFRELYLKNQLKTPPGLMEHQEKTYEFIKWNRQFQRWIFDLEHQLALTEIVNIILKYPDINRTNLQLTKVNFIKGKINAKGRVDLNRLKEIAEAMLETTKSNPPVIRRTKSHSDEKILKRIEEITEEVKKTKRLTFKSTEEIKNLLSEGSETNNTDSEKPKERVEYIKVIIEIYDLFFHLCRVLKSNRNDDAGKLFNEVTKQLKTIESLLKNIGLETIECYGQSFDSTLMESVGTVMSSQTDSLKEFMVADELTRGFIDTTQNKIIREAKVITVLN